MKTNRLFQLLPLGFILVIAMLLRLYKIDTPLLDWHSFRQADTASVTREYVKNGIDLLRPRYHDLSNIQTGQENPNGYRMVEFPLVNAVLALIISSVPTINLVILSRVASALASLVTIVAIYYLGSVWSGKAVGVTSAVVFATLPFAVFYSRVVLPEPFLLATSTSAIALFYYWLKHKKVWAYSMSFLLLSLAFLLKPFAAFLAPVFIILIFLDLHRLSLKNRLAVLGFSLSIIPLVLWRNWILNFPDGIPASSWLLNGNGIRLRPAWFRWLFFERLTKLILGYVGVMLLPLAVIKAYKREWLIYGSWWIGILAFFVVIATGNVQHDYYQNLMLPILALTIGRGLVILFRLLEHKFLPIISGLICATFYSLLIFISWQYVRGNFNVNHWEYQVAGQAADALLPPQAKVIAPAMGDTQFLFQTNRRGWPIGFEIDKKIQAGATHYINTSKDVETNELKTRYTIIKETEQYVIIDLSRPKQL